MEYAREMCPQSLDLLKRRVETPTFKRVLNDVHEKVRSGTALSEAFAEHGGLFPSVYTASLLAGERSHLGANEIYQERRQRYWQSQAERAERSEQPEPIRLAA